MRNALIVAALACVFVAGASRANTDDQRDSLKETVRSLQERIAALEKQVAALQPLREAHEQHQQYVKEVRDIGGTPGAIESTNQPVGADAPLTVGQFLQVEWGGQWWAAKVLEVLDDGTVGIHFLGWQSSYDETVPRSRLQLDPDAMEKARQAVGLHSICGNDLLDAPIQSSGIAVSGDVELKVGQPVYVEWGGQWWAGKVVKPHSDGRVEIHYDGWDSTWDEVVTRSRLQLYSQE